MTTITIPKELARKGDLIIIPREEYKVLLSNRLRRNEKYRSQLDKDLEMAIKDVRRGKLIGPFKSAKELRISLEK